jgi:hypothetical protein
VYPEYAIADMHARALERMKAGDAITWSLARSAGDA